jgi:hypothetical protein
LTLNLASLFQVEQYASDFQQSPKALTFYLVSYEIIQVQ